MTYLILSDIHGNREALEAVLAHAHGRYQQIVCLGDLVGYGADPNFVCDWGRQNVAAIIRGNHDRITVENAALDSYRPDARDGVAWTRSALTPVNLDYLSNLPHGPVTFVGFTLAHGSVVDEDQYLVTANDAALLLPHLKTVITFFGHTHIQGGFVVSDAGAIKIEPEGTLEIRQDHGFYLVNPGSVGQPRDGNWRAGYALYSPEDRRVEYVRVAALLLRPSAIFNLLKLPVMWQFYGHQTASDLAAFLFVVFWLMLTFWVARWGTWCFWASILLQIGFVGFPEVRAAISSGAPDLLELRHNWPVWLFTAGLLLEILEWAKHLKPPNVRQQLLDAAAKPAQAERETRNYRQGSSAPTWRTERFFEPVARRGPPHVRSGVSIYGLMEPSYRNPSREPDRSEIDADNIRPYE